VVDLLDTKDPVITLVDRKLREEYMAVTAKYVSTCQLGGGDEEREFAYARARKVWDRFDKAKDVAAADYKRSVERDMKKAA
jgi:hypothetical protein